MIPLLSPFLKKIRGFFCILVFVFLVGCGSNDQSIEPTENTAVAETTAATELILKDEYLNMRIKEIDEQVQDGDLTGEEAQNLLQTEIQDLQKLNDGSLESILTKLSYMDELAAERFETMVRERHPEMFE